MDNDIPEIKELIQQFSKLPGLGPKSAKRIILKLINNKISLENYKFNYLTKKRFNKINDIMLTTYEIKKSNRNINSISISFKKPGNYYLDNIAF